MMNRGYFEKSLLMKVVSLIRPDWIMEYLTALRKVEYYSNRGRLSENQDEFSSELN